MLEKDCNQVLMSFFQDDEIKAFSLMYEAFKKAGRNINLQDVLNELENQELINRNQAGNYQRTKKLQLLFEDLPLSYSGQPYSYYKANRA